MYYHNSILKLVIDMIHVTAILPSIISTSASMSTVSFKIESVTRNYKHQSKAIPPVINQLKRKD